MNIEDAIAQNTKAVQENTAVLREILSLGATASAEALTKPAPKKKVKVKEEPENDEPTPVKEEARKEIQEVLTQDPPITLKGEPSAEAPSKAETPEIDTEEVPDLPPAELLASLKEAIKGKLLASTDGSVKITFEALRAKYGVSVIKELNDEQVPEFYKEVLSW